ncbi:alpha/beta hydrolase family protein [Patescibacteria group bacterium]
MKKRSTLLAITIIGVSFFTFGVGWFLQSSSSSPLKFLSPLPETDLKVAPEEELITAYSFPNLKKRRFRSGPIKIGEVIKEEKEFTAYFFTFKSEGKDVSGQLNVPHEGKDLPVLVLLRGYVDKEIYFTGLGTRKVAAYFAKNGFITLSPDFLGFGRSDQESKDILLNRFRRPVTVLSLLASLENLNLALRDRELLTRAAAEKVFLWGHSNGGQIALSVLEISGQEIPTVLWAPVSKPFPDSVLEYASEMDDLGRIVIEAIDSFSKKRDSADYSITNFFGWIQAPLQVHQGTADNYISLTDTEGLVRSLQNLNKEASLWTYEGDDHNLKISWDQVVERDLEFFRKNMVISNK